MSDDDTLDPMDAIADEEESEDLGSDLDLDPEELKGLDKDEEIDADTR